MAFLGLIFLTGCALVDLRGFAEGGIEAIRHSVLALRLSEGRVDAEEPLWTS